MASLAAVLIGGLAVYMYFKTREPAPSPLLNLRLSDFSPVADQGTIARIREAARPAIGDKAAAVADERCETDGSRFLYRAKTGQGPGAATLMVLLDTEFHVLGTRRSIAA